jgi:hypothetical protein
MPSFIDSKGQRQSFEPKLEHYAEAFGQGLTLRQYYTQKLDTDEEKYGSAFDQVLASSGLFLKPDKQTGIRPPTVASLLGNGGGADIGMALTRPDGTNALTLTGRLMFPAVVMELADQFLMNDDSSFNALFESMVAVTQTIDSPHAFQPLINVTGPQASRSQPISQLAEPVNMATISLSEKSFKLPTWSIGLEISDEAARATTLDLVGIAIREQALGEKSARINEAIKALVDGDTDLGISAISGVNASTFDSTVTAGTMTNKAWIKILRERWRKQTYSHIICDVDSYLIVEGRTGRPTVTENDGTGRLTSLPSAINPNFPTTLSCFLLDSSSILGANTIVLLDRSKAIRKVVYTGASYQAVENYVMRRSTAFRFDFSEGYFRLFDRTQAGTAGDVDGWRKVVLA